MLASLKGKSGQGATVPYISTWPLYEECMFLADHIVARKYVFCFMCIVQVYVDKIELYVSICFPEHQVVTIQMFCQKLRTLQL